MPPFRLLRCSQILPYSVLLQELQIDTIRELEDLIIDAIYLDVLRGKLDQKEQQLEIEYTMGRDLEPGKLEHLLQALQNWCVTPPLSIESRFMYDSGQRRRRPCCQSSIRSSWKRQPTMPQCKRRTRSMKGHIRRT